jgi:hypothetical protein
MTWTSSDFINQDVAAEAPVGELMIAGRRPVDGDQPRSAPAIESIWISTFNQRWWVHIVDDGKASSQRPAHGPGGVHVAATPNVPPM